MRLTRRAFVERLDFRTSPGYLEGGAAREALGMPGGGPQAVITYKAIFDFANSDREMQLASLHPGVIPDEVRANMGWEVRMAAAIAETTPPTAEELRIIGDLDPGEGV